ncbi:MAG: alpha/beta hydrolase [Pseudomonadota bacterium]
MKIVVQKFAGRISARFICLGAIVALLAACSDGDGSNTLFEEVPSLDLAFTASPIDVQNSQAQFAQNVAYGDEERNLFDIWLPDSDGPTPLAIYIHGGAFRGGDKAIEEGPLADIVRELLDRGIAVASSTYYLLSTDPVDTNGVMKSLNDSKRALQFMRYHARSLNIDPDNVAIFGGSAGAGTALWLGTHDELAEPDSTDPILRQSSRVQAVGALATQATYELVRWEQVLQDAIAPFAALLGGTDIVTISNAVGATDLLLAFLAIDSVDQIDSPEARAIRENIDMLALMDSSDAPIYVSNTTPSPDDLVDLLFHHALHARALKETADAVGLESVVYADDPSFSIVDPSGEDLVSFISRHIN